MFLNSKNMNVQNNRIDTNRIDTLIGETTNIIGNINTAGVVKIDGKYTGDIFTEADLIVGETGFIKGNIEAENISINGYIEGNVKCLDTLEILANGKLYGDAELGNFCMSRGAIFNGKCTMTNKQCTSLKLSVE